jgi:hypothetical protein
MHTRIEIGKRKRGKTSESHFLIQAHMLTKEERDDGEGARINKWLELADAALQQSDDEDAA